MRPLSQITIRLLTCFLVILLLPGWGELADSAFGASTESSAVAVSIGDPCCDEIVAIAVDTEEVDSRTDCSLTCEHCWCCGSLPALPSIPRVSSDLLWIIAANTTPGPSPQAPPLRAIPPPIRPPIS